MIVHTIVESRSHLPHALRTPLLTTFAAAVNWCNFSNSSVDAEAIKRYLACPYRILGLLARGRVSDNELSWNDFNAHEFNLERKKKGDDRYWNMALESSSYLRENKPIKRSIGRINKSGMLQEKKKFLNKKLSRLKIAISFVDQSSQRRPHCNHLYKLWGVIFSLWNAIIVHRW